MLRRLSVRSLTILSVCIQYLQLLVLVPATLTLGLIYRKPLKKDRRVTLGGAGIINLSRWSDALVAHGISARTVVWSTPTIFPSDTFDVDLSKRWGNLSGVLAPFVFLREVYRSDTLILGFDGFVLGCGHLRRFEHFLISLTGRKTVVVPYGADSFVYSAIRSEALAHGLQISYPSAARCQRKIARDVQRAIESADFLFHGVMTFDGFGRWDALPFNSLVVDIERWRPGDRDWESESLRVVHAPNHRGFKGTEFLIDAVSRLQHEGELIELDLLEAVPNEKLRENFASRYHVLVEQLIGPGYAMNGVEGLASGLVVVSNLSDERIMTPMKRWSFAGECPIISATPETIYDVLKRLVSKRDKLAAVGELSRRYAEKFHSGEAFAEFYAAIDEYLWGNGPSPINFFHPLLGAYRKHLGPIKPIEI